MNDNKCENIGKYISQLHRKGNVFINRELSKYDLSVGQFMFLLDLYIKDGKNQEEISDNLKIDKGTTARAIKKLEEQGFVIRIKNENDKRSNKIYLTDKAKDIKENVFDILDDWNQKISMI
jgi:DNA-binding MarR family transcriptional regulator